MATFGQELPQCAKGEKDPEQSRVKRGDSGGDAFRYGSWHDATTHHIEALACLVANPAEAVAVRYAKDWPGAHTLPRDIGARVRLPQRACSTAHRRARQRARASRLAGIEAHRHCVCGRTSRASAGPRQARSKRRSIRQPQPAGCGRRAQGAAANAVRRLRAFNVQYDTALAAWGAGKLSVRFPIGTWCQWVSPMGGEQRGAAWRPLLMGLI